MARIMPGVQMPHWAPPSARKHCWMGWSFWLIWKAFDGDDVGALGLQDWDEAGVDELGLSVSPVHQDGAGAAFAFAAAFLCAG